MDRRTFIHGAVASLAAPKTLAASPANRFDVVVVGAGLAGLNAALTFQLAGMKAIVLEASEHPGGRVRTLDLPFGRVNVGGTTIGPYYARLRTLAQELDVELESPRFRPKMANYINGTLMAGDDWRDSPANLTVGTERELQPTQLEFGLVRSHIPLKELDDWLRPDLIEAFDIPYVSFLKGKGISDEAIRLINVTTNCTDVRNVSALGQLRDLHRIGWGLSQTESSRRSVYDPPEGRAHQVKDGTQRLAEAMETALDLPIRYRTPIVAVDQSKADVIVTSLDGEEFKANYAVVAAPPPALRNIRFTPGLTGKLLDAVTSSIHSSTAHFFYAVKVAVLGKRRRRTGPFFRYVRRTCLCRRKRRRGHLSRLLGQWRNSPAARPVACR